MTNPGNKIYENCKIQKLLLTIQYFVEYQSLCNTAGNRVKSFCTYSFGFLANSSWGKRQSCEETAFFRTDHKFSIILRSGDCGGQFSRQGHFQKIRVFPALLVGAVLLEKIMQIQEV